MITEIVWNGETYRIRKGKVYDCSWLEVPTDISSKVYAEYLKQVDYKTLLPDSLNQLVLEIKQAELFDLCLEVGLFGLQKFAGDAALVKSLLPGLTSCYRKIGHPQKAIDLFGQYKSNAYASDVLYVSVGAAYCDLDDYDTALKFANRAVAIGMGNNSIERAALFRRIKAATK